MERRHHPRPGLREFRPGQPTDGQMCSRKVPEVTTWAFRHTPPKLKVPVKRWSVGTFARLIGSAFAFSQMNPLRDCHLRTHQALRGYTRLFARAYFLQANNASHVAVGRTMCHAATKSARLSIAPSPETPVGTDSVRAASSLLSRLGQKKQERREEAVNSIDFSHSSRKAWRTINNLLAGLDAPFTSAPSLPTPTTQYGTAASPASCCDCCLIDTWSAWSWSWLAIAASPSPPETTKEAGYDTSRTASHRELFWRPFSSTSTSLTCQLPSRESMHMLTT